MNYSLECDTLLGSAWEPEAGDAPSPAPAALSFTDFRVEKIPSPLGLYLLPQCETDEG